MTRRRTDRPKRAYHAFPWRAAAVNKAVELATLVENKELGMSLPAISYRTIAAELYNRGFVDHLPDPATVRRVVIRARQQGIGGAPCQR